ncbi:MAG: DEAD/DEAH box helicase, partial [Ilumatobacteraceae bacterium]
MIRSIVLGLARIGSKRHLDHVVGFQSFRGDQEWAIQRVLDGKNTLLIAATGSGKSLAYQLPSLLLRKGWDRRKRALATGEQLSWEEEAIRLTEQIEQAAEEGGEGGGGGEEVADDTAASSSSSSSSS